MKISLYTTSVLTSKKVFRGHDATTYKIPLLRKQLLLKIIVVAKDYEN